VSPRGPLLVYLGTPNPCEDKTQKAQKENKTQTRDPNLGGQKKKKKIRFFQTQPPHGTQQEVENSPPPWLVGWNPLTAFSGEAPQPKTHPPFVPTELVLVGCNPPPPQLV